MTVWPVLAIFVATFVLLQNGDRTLVMTVGAAVMLTWGWLDGFYPPSMALAAIQVDTLVLIFGLSMISATLARSGWFASMAVRVALYVRGDGLLILVLLSLVTYAVSLVVNNLAAMLVMLPVTLPLCRASRIDPVPVVIALIIASNLGGASTMIGDFPNMIIASVAHLHFIDFIAGMMVPCLILLAVLLLYFYRLRRTLTLATGEAASDETLVAEISRVWQGKRDPHLFRLGMVTLLLALLGFLLAGWWGWRPAWVALAAGVFLLLFGRFAGEELSAGMGVVDILFFAGLFILVGGLQAAGVLDRVAWLVQTFGGSSLLGRLLVLMWLAGLLTLFLNAGPATALLLPLAQGMGSSDPLVWWALSLGVLAGSSGALTGATAGAVAASAVERYLHDHPQWARSLPQRQGLTFRAHLAHGLPIMIIFLSFSSYYLWLSGPA